MKKMITLLLLLAPVLFGGCKVESTDPPDPEPQGPGYFIRGADLSFLPDIQAASILFYTSGGVQKDMLSQFKDAGCNTVRIRLWHTPAENTSSLPVVKQFAQQVKAAGMGVWLCIHYSDTWADPGQQTVPVAWAGLPADVLGDSIYAYTFKVIQTLEPDFVQTGNEVNDGFVWPQGRISTGGKFHDLMARAVSAGRAARPQTRIMVHYAGVNGAVNFFSQLGAKNLEYDIAGISYYPVWHGKDLGYVQSVLASLGKSTGKAVVIAETAYPFTLDWADNTHNLIGLPEHLLPEYPASPEGQKGFLLKVKQMTGSFTQGAGFCYWGGEWVAYKGSQATNGSSWENQALFDFNFKGLPALEAFSE